MISFNLKRVELEKLYSELIISTEQYRLSECNKEKDYVLFGAIAGQNYRPNGLMIIGRSPNGWHRYELSTRDLFNGPERIFDYPEKLTELRLSNTSSQLWQVMNKIGIEILGDNWEQSILYSNYFKLTPDENAEKHGTPPCQLRNLEQDLCNKILHLELEVYQPKHIIAFTGCNVEDLDFSERLMPKLLTYYSSEDFTNKSWPYPIKRILWGKYALEIYQINKTFIYLTEHPERKSCSDHANILIDALKSNI